MVPELVSGFFQFLKLAPRYLIALGVMAGALLFLNPSTLEQLGVTNFADANREILGLTLVVTTLLFVTTLFADLLVLGMSLLRSRNNLKKVAYRLNNLTEDEKQILRYYLAENTRANTLRVEDGVVQGLKSSGVIYMSASMGNLVEGFAHNISDFAWDYLHKHPELLFGSTDTYRTDKHPRRW
jgi:Super-infection exclusion protein B